MAWLAQSHEIILRMSAAVGQQMQVGFGQKMMPDVGGGQTKVYVAAFVLSRPRYKYAQEQSRPFTSVGLVRICHDCYRYMGGAPAEPQSF